MTTTDHVAYRHEAAAPLTVGALRDALAEAPDDSTILMMVCEAPWSGNARGYLARSVEVRPPLNWNGAAIVLTSGPPSGNLRRPRPGRLVVEHGPIGEDAVEHLRQVVHDAVSTTGYRGQHNIACPGSVTTWDWESTGTVHVADVVAVAEAAAATVNPGQWTIRSEVGE